MNKKILVTGGTGYIGSHTVVELLNKNYDVVIADNLSNSYQSVVDAIEKITGVKPVFEKTELTDQEQTQKLFEKHSDLAGIIHFAALKAVGESVEKPLDYYHNNLSSLINILRGALKHNISNFVFSSSCTVYGQPDVLPVKETSPIQPALSPYGNTKQIGEEIITDFAAANHFKAILLRYFNPIGAHPSALIGELPLGAPNNLVPLITQTAIGKRPLLKVFGTDYNTPDGTCIRDYIHVVDLAKAHIIALERMLENRQKMNVEVFNLGTGNGFSVLEVINAFEKNTGIKLNYVNTSRRPGDIEKIWADTTYANTELGWKAEESLDEMVLSAWRWECHLKESF
ncbi:MAG: UDP-glucose 4-epimerase [Bacteroidetes bacterium ADurb.Bin408]|nr:MAG: UDP-glucose 4-epimerase [Bacteroidetes bacterium ADurb.Bin408]